MSEFGIEMVESPFLPEGTFILAHHMNGVRLWDTEPLRLRPDPWGPAPYALRPKYADERRKGLDFLARLLDGMCADLGMDPDKAWREPREQERRDREWRRGEYVYRVEERMALTLIDPGAFVSVAGA